MKLRSLGLTLGTSAIALALFSASATAETLVTKKACYVIPVPYPNANNQVHPIHIPVTGAGWKPGDLISVGVQSSGALNWDTGDGAVKSNSVVAAADGSVSTNLELTTVDGDPLEQRVVIGAGDNNIYGDKGARITVTVATRAAATTAGTKGPTILGSQRTTWYASGFPAGKLYAHFVHGNRAFATIFLGVSKGPCSGIVKRRALAYPAHGPSYSDFTVVVNRSREYSPKTRPSVHALDGIV